MTNNNFAIYDSGMNFFRQQQTDSNVKFVCKNGTIGAHRQVLSARSIYFNVILICNDEVDSEHTLNFVNTPVEVVEILLHFIYTGEILLKTNCDYQKFKNTIDKCNQTEVASLLDIFWGSYANLVTVKNFVGLWHLADVCDQLEVNSVLLNFLVQHVCKILRHPEEYVMLSTSQMELCVNYAVGRVFGDLIAKMVIMWGEYDQIARLNTVHKFIDKINWMSEDRVIQLIKIDIVHNSDSLKYLLHSKIPDLKPSESGEIL